MIIIFCYFPGVIEMLMEQGRRHARSNWISNTLVVSVIYHSLKMDMLIVSLGCFKYSYVSQISH